MARALEEARAAASAGEVPVGAVIVREGEELVATQNRMIRDRDATSHAELLALRAASQLLGDQRLAGCTEHGRGFAAHLRCRSERGTDAFLNLVGQLR